MQISKCFLVVCAATYCTVVLPLRAADTDTDVKLREAMRQKISELQTQPTPQPTPVAKPSSAAAQPVTPPPPAVVQPVPVPPPATPPPPTVAPPKPAAQAPVNQESIDKARETLHRQMTELENQPPAAAATNLPSPKKADSQPGQKSAEAKAQETAGKPQAQPKAGDTVKKPAKAASAFTPIQVPPPAVSADKQTRLAELLRKYKADALTPEEYHKQRAKILSEP
jgi:hypothetical protein